MFRFFYVILKNIFRAPYLLPMMRYMTKHSDKYSEKRRYKLARHLIYLLKKSGNIETIGSGMENLPKEGGYVMYPNHQGKYDVLGIMNAHTEPCTFVMDRNKSHSLLVREFVDLLEGKRMDIKDVRQAMKIILEISEEVTTGKRFIIFPEGGYDNNKNTVEDFKAGSFKCAQRAKVPIVPVALIDSYKPFNSFSMKKVTTYVHFLEPIYYEEYKELKTQEIANMVKARIVAYIEEHNKTISA